MVAYLLQVNSLFSSFWHFSKSHAVGAFAMLSASRDERGAHNQLPRGARSAGLFSHSLVRARMAAGGCARIEACSRSLRGGK